VYAVTGVTSKSGLPGRAGLVSPISEADLRVSDRERDQVATELGEHFQAGRLDQDEFDERVTLALRAKTRRHLATLMADLPRERQSGSPDKPAQDADQVWGAEGRGPRVRLLIPLLIAMVIIVSATQHGGGHEHGGSLWPLLFLWWLIPLAVFRVRSGLSRRR
jgi:hypothetical protein